VISGKKLEAKITDEHSASDVENDITSLRVCSHFNDPGCWLGLTF
jgi:hypothetical protein